MGKIVLQLKAKLQPLGKDFLWSMKMNRGQCGKISDK